MEILVVNSSGRSATSVSRQLVAELTDKLTALWPEAHVVHRDVAAGLPFVDDLMIGAYFTPDAVRTPAQQESLKVSNTLVAEVKAADILVLGMPIYNFGLPASMKAYVDLICRSGLTFNLTAEGYVGLLHHKKVYVVVTSGGTEVGSPYDFATPHLRAILGLMGLTNVEIIPADQLMSGGEAHIGTAQATIQELHDEASVLA
jgi:FMN-dependent NADH-azoreductase